MSSATAKGRQLLTAGEILDRHPTLKRKTLMYAARTGKVFSTVEGAGSGNRRQYDYAEVRKKLVFDVLGADTFTFTRGGVRWDAVELIEKESGLDRATVDREIRRNGITFKLFPVEHPVIRRVFVARSEWDQAITDRPPRPHRRVPSKLHSLPDDQFILRDEAKLLGFGYWELHEYSEPVGPKNKSTVAKSHPILGRPIEAAELRYYRGQQPYLYTGYRIGDLREIDRRRRKATPAPVKGDYLNPDDGLIYKSRDEAAQLAGVKPHEIENRRNLPHAKWGGLIVRAVKVPMRWDTTPGHPLTVKIWRYCEADCRALATFLKTGKLPTPGHAGAETVALPNSGREVANQPAVAGASAEITSLTPREIYAIRAMRQLKAVDERSRRSCREITQIADAGADPENYKHPLLNLRNRGFAGSRRGPAGGYWLTPSGINADEQMN